jgi:hypothetical protein
MPESETRTTLLATHVPAGDDARSAGASQQQGHVLNRMRIVSTLVEHPTKGQVVLEKLAASDAPGAPLAAKAGDLAISGRWDVLRPLLADLTWDEVSELTDAWTDAETAVAEQVADLVRQLPELQEPERVGREPIADGSADNAGEPQATTMPTLATRLSTIDGGQAAVRYLYPIATRVEADASRIISNALLKKMTVTGIVTAHKTEPVGYLHLEKLFFEPQNVVEGELVQTIPLMPGETRRFTHTEWANTKSDYTKFVASSLEKAAEETLAETSELSDSTNTETQRDMALSVATNVSGSYGTVTFGASAGLNVSSSEQQSRAASATKKREVTQKASSRTKEERKIEFHFATEEGSSDLAFQEITNQTEHPVSWAYHRLMTKWKVQLARYDVRLTYDLIVPDPANRLLRLHEELRRLRNAVATDDVFPVALDDVNQQTFQELAATFGVPLEPPPEIRIWVARGASHDVQKNDVKHPTLTLTAPSGYKFSGQAVVELAGNSNPSDSTGIAPYESLNKAQMQEVTGTYDWLYSYVGESDLENGSVGITVRAETLVERVTYQQWRMSSWQRLRDAYIGERERKRAEWRRRIDEIEELLGASDALSLRKLEREEIMRVALAWLVGPQFDFYPDDLPGPNPAESLGPDIGLYTNEGQIQSDKVFNSFVRHGDVIRFLHQAIEWENVLYIVYPYFWTHEARWQSKDEVRHPDLVHQAFLRGGAARVILTIRPDFEKAFLAYQENGFLGGKLPQDHPYVTVADELRAMASTNYPYTPAANPPNPKNIVDTWSEYTPTSGLAVKKLLVG